MHRPAVARLAHYGITPALSELPPAYLAPSLHFSVIRAPQHSSFSTTSAAAARNGGRDLNRNRGVSAIHRTGPRFKLSAANYPLPRPVPLEVMKARSKTPDHGLWAFFPPSREALSTPEFDIDFGAYNAYVLLLVTSLFSAYLKLIMKSGRPWAIQELRDRSWDDLHRLWWVCVKERNRIATSAMERQRLKAGYGEYEASERDHAVSCDIPTDVRAPLVCCFHYYPIPFLAQLKFAPEIWDTIFVRLESSHVGSIGYLVMFDIANISPSRTDHCHTKGHKARPA